LSEAEQKIFDELKKIFDANTALRTQALTLPDGTVATDEEDFKTKAQAIYDNGKSAWETARA